MKHIQEKVKDLIEVRSYKSLQDFISDPTETLSAYYFTDITSDMMSKWLDRLADVEKDNGQAYALAGYRGVGKSHFLATLGAIVSQPELRSRISEPHVSASTQRLKRRRYPMAFVRRGTNETLLDELKDSVAATFGIERSSLAGSIPDILRMLSDRAGDLPFVLIIDTAFERTSRVSRDDGAILSEIAQIAKTLNIFLAVALDDDIAGADGVNSPIARSFTINYLDQEHLYRVVDSNIFPKRHHTPKLLHEIYSFFRGVLPSFRWSEQRFMSLYPLHPVILEVAPFVRLYKHDFSLLSFAAEAGSKLLGRPAASLIALDEVFDCAENDLRKVDVLKETFEAYDKLNREVVAKIPVMQRLQAKLILKGLVLLSLDGDGTTAKEIGAAMMIFDEDQPENGLKWVEDLIEKFVSVLPDQIWRKKGDNGEVRYSLKVSIKDNLNTALAQAVSTVSPDVVSKILRKMARDRFSDWSFSDETGAGGDWTECQIVWRGGVRRGRLCWNLENRALDLGPAPANLDVWDWMVVISSDDAPFQTDESEEIPKVYWQHAPLEKDEIDTILRYYVLLNNVGLRQEYGEQLRAAGHVHSLMVEKIWNRIFLEDGKLVIKGFDYNFTEDARQSQTLSGIFSVMLEPLFEIQYPQHPVFEQTLGMTEVSALVNDFFSGARQNLHNVQQLARTFGLPLGLVIQRGNTLVPETEENLIKMPLAQEVLLLVDDAGEETVSLKTIYRRLKRPPVGLVREAQHLILTALVANRQIEFVTTMGNRINRRSLDLKIIWDDIEGVAKPSGTLYPVERLTEWARILTGNKTFKSINSPGDRLGILKALRIWLNDWNAAQTIERFEQLPDEILNTRIWRLATNVDKAFGSVAITTLSVLDEAISLEEGLQRIADAFSDSEEEFLARTRDLVVLEDFIGSSARREEIRSYLAVCETTEDEKVEFLREKLFDVIEETISKPNQLTNREMENLWEVFHARLTEYYSMKHDLIMKSHTLQERFDEIMRSDEWWEFENLSRLPVFPQVHWDETQKICQQFRNLDCRYNVREMLKTHPFCACSFSLARLKEWEYLPETLIETINRGRESYRRTLLMLRDTLVKVISHLAGQLTDKDYAAAASGLAGILNNGKEIPPLGTYEIIVLQKAFETLPTSLLLKTSVPPTGDFVSRDELREQMSRWLDDLPDQPVLVKL